MKILRVLTRPIRTSAGETKFCSVYTFSLKWMLIIRLIADICLLYPSLSNPKAGPSGRDVTTGTGDTVTDILEKGGCNYYYYFSYAM